MVQSCSKCKIGTNTAVDAGSLWCTGCGEQIVAQCEWTFSYSNRTNNYRRVPVYSRLKRFREWCIKTRIPYVLQHMSSILDLYAKLEFGWINNKKKRCYFFNKNCILFFCVTVLGITSPTHTIKTLKDEERVDAQLLEMCNLLEHHVKIFS